MGMVLRKNLETIADLRRLEIEQAVRRAADAGITRLSGPIRPLAAFTLKIASPVWKATPVLSQTSI